MKQMQKTFFALGTVNTVSVFYEEDSHTKMINILNHIKNQTLMLDDKLSFFKENSDVARINRAAGKHMVKVSPETWKIVQMAMKFSQNSNGAFDITAGGLSKIWRNARKENKIPDKEEIKNQMNLTNYKDIKMEEHKIGLSRPGQNLDLGGIAKGFAADEAKRILIEENITDAMINFGGTIVTMGSTKQIGIQNPDANTGKAVGTIQIKEKAVVTSGLYEQYFIKDGCRFHHIIDPRTGMPSQSGLLSISVIGNSAMEMDALATAVFIMGIKDGAALLDTCHAEAVFVDESRDVYITKGLTDTFRKHNKENLNHG